MEHSTNFGRFVSGKSHLGQLRNRPTYLDVGLSEPGGGGGSSAVELFCCPSIYTLCFLLVVFFWGGMLSAPVLDLPLILLLFFILHEGVNIFKCIYEKTA